MLMDISLPAGLKLRPAQKEDEPFLEQLFRSTRTQLFQILQEKQLIESLIGQQFQLQQNYYKQQWPNASNLILCLADKPVGKIILDKSKTHIHVIDIAVEESVRGQGLGTSLIFALQNFATKHALAIKLAVARDNLAAKKLYLTLGFYVTNQSATHEFLEWSLQGASTDPRPFMALQE